MTRHTIRGNNRSKLRSHNLEVSRTKSARTSSSPQTKRYAVKSMSKETQTQQMRKQQSNHQVKKSQNLKKVSPNSKEKSDNGVFKYLIVITCTIFTFGSLGFGYTLRYAHKWQKLMINNSDLHNAMTRGQEVIQQDMMRELRINN
ncbi:hypothetical protein AA637_04195 [Cyanobacterium sp. HL-69]|nr:hypothetical protein AA637_04195 [Cyanobacterium sp. HL-69]